MRTDRLHAAGKPNVFGLPKGFFGVLAGWIMGRTGVRHNRWAVSVLDVSPDDQVLEIGFGPGVGIRLLSERATRGFVAGVDPSAMMVRQAHKHNGALVKAGRVALHEGSVSALPFDDNRFDKVLSVNNIMMWPQILADLQEIRRVMKPGGLLVISLNPRWAENTDDVIAMGQEIVGYVTGAGFMDVQAVVRTDLKPYGGVAVSASGSTSQ